MALLPSGMPGLDSSAEISGNTVPKGTPELLVAQELGERLVCSSEAAAESRNMYVYMFSLMPCDSDKGSGRQRENT